MHKSFSISRGAWILTVTLPVVLLVAHPSLARSLGLDVWNLPSLHQSSADSKARERQLDGRDADVRKRIAIKEALVGDLIAERATLEEVATHFLALNASLPEHMEIIRLSYPGSTDFEKSVQNVIDFTGMRVPAGEVRDRLLERLEAERARMNLLASAH